MSELVDPSRIETIVGARRESETHLGRAVPPHGVIYVLHSARCLASTPDLRECAYSRALDRGVDIDAWPVDVAVRLRLDGGKLGVTEAVT